MRESHYKTFTFNSPKASNGFVSLNERAKLSETNSFILRTINHKRNKTIF